jgi:hypothetical protein
VQLKPGDLEALFKGAILAVAEAERSGKLVTWIADGTDLETTAQEEGCSRVTRQQQITDKRGHVHEIEVTGYGCKLRVLLEARSKIPLAAKGVPIQEHATLSRRAVVRQARTHRAGHARNGIQQRNRAGEGHGCGGQARLTFGIAFAGRMAPHGRSVAATQLRQAPGDLRAQRLDLLVQKVDVRQLEGQQVPVMVSDQPIQRLLQQHRPRGTRVERLT